MSVLVTGGAGYIGSHTVRALRQRGREVVVLDSLEFGNREAVGDAALVVGDIADEDLVSAVCSEYGVDSCVHFAGYKSVGESTEWPARYFSNNVGKTVALLDVLRQQDVDRFVFSSTCAVYGTPKTLPVSETSPVDPESPYGESKALVERVLHWFDACHGFRSVSLRYFNATGAAPDGSIGEDWTVTLNLVPLVMKAACGLRELQIFGTDYPTRDGTAIRDYVHVDDLADAHVKALEYLERGGATTILNLGTGQGSTVKEVIEAARRASGREIPAIEVARRPGDAEAVWADTAMAESVLGWKASRDLDDIVETAWRWHSKSDEAQAALQRS